MHELIPKDLPTNHHNSDFYSNIFLIARLIFKVWSKAGLVVSLIIRLMFSYGYVYLHVGFAIGSIPLEEVLFLIISHIAAFIGGCYNIFKTKKKLENITKILNVVTITRTPTI